MMFIVFFMRGRGVQNYWILWLRYIYWVFLWWDWYDFYLSDICSVVVVRGVDIVGVSIVVFDYYYMFVFSVDFFIFQIYVIGLVVILCEELYCEVNVFQIMFGNVQIMWYG